MLTTNLLHIKNTVNMKTYGFLVVLMIAMSSLTYGQDYGSLINEAENLFYQGKYENAANRYEQAFRLGRASEAHLYGAACAWAKAGNPTKAMEKLRMAVDRGWLALEPLQADPDLAGIRGTNEWNALIGNVRERITALEAGFDRKLVAQLATIEERDQRYRREIRSLEAQDSPDQGRLEELQLLQAELDAVNIAEIHPMIEQYGYPGKNLVGNKCEVVFVAIQNADLETQKFFLPVLEEAASRDDIPYFSFMRMVERIETQEGRLLLTGGSVSRRDWSNQIDVSVQNSANPRTIAQRPANPAGTTRWDVEPAATPRSGGLYKRK